VKPRYHSMRERGFWIVDLVGETITQYTEPIRGEFRRTKKVARSGSLSPIAFKGITFKADDILGASSQAKGKKEPAAKLLVSLRLSPAPKRLQRCLKRHMLLLREVGVALIQCLGLFAGKGEGVHIG